MYEIIEKSRKVDGVEVTTYQREIINCNILSVEAGCRGRKNGGDHGAQVYFKIENKASTQWEINPIVTEYGCEGVEVKMVGSSELETIIEALKFITKALEEGRNDA